MSTSYSAIQPDFFPQLIALARRTVAPMKIMLFGSQATGEATRESDIDLAFFSLGNPGQWGVFCALAAEELPTLRTLDLLNAEQADAGLVANVIRTGKVIYER